MVKKILKYLNKEISGLHQAAYLLGICAFLSQLMALVRDRLLAWSFGASHSLDVYYAAFRIPDFVFASIASVVSISVLIPFLVERLETDKGKEFIDNVFSTFVWFMGAVSIILYLSMPALMRFFFPTLAAGADGPEMIGMARVLLLSPLFLGFSNFLASITQVYKRFLIYALAPLLYNGGIIFGIVVLYPHFGLIGLAYGVAFGALLHFSIQLPFIIEKGLLPTFRWNIDFASIRQVASLSLPRTFTASSNEILEFFMISLASIMASGSISVFNFAWNLQSVPLSIIGVSYSLAAFPALARHFAKGERDLFLAQMVGSARHIIFWSVPIMVQFIVLRAQIVRVILGTGQFNWADTRLTAAALAFFTLSLVPQGLMLLFVRSYYARGKTMKPLLINFVCAAGSIALAYWLYHFFLDSPLFRVFIEQLMRVDSVSGTEVLMLPLAFAVGVSINMLTHWIDFSFDYPEFTKPVFKVLFQVFGASVLMGWLTYTLLPVFDHVFGHNTAVGVFLQGFLSGTGGIIFGILVLIALRSHELSEVWKALHRKIWKAKPLVADQIPM